MKELQQFSEKLKLRLNGNQQLRPFVCNGNPLNCEVFIVVYNPATEMERLFLDDWCDNGFDKKQWMKYYVEERQNKVSKTGRKSNKLSNTRQRIEWLSKSLPYQCLETNLYSKSTRKANDLKPEDKDTTLFQFLIDEIKPKVLVIHGVQVKKDFEKLFNLSLKQDDFLTCTIYGNSVLIVSKRHFSRGWSKSAVDGFADEIKNVSRL